MEDATSHTQGGSPASSTAEMVARRSYGKLVAFLAARTHDVAAAEDALSEAFASALTNWSRDGCPSNPEAWLLTVARRKAIDNIRGQRRDEKLAELLKLIPEAAPAEEIPDNRLALMFACAHPAIDDNIRAPLILQVIMGLDARAIASAFLTSPAAMSKRLVRAKDKIRLAGISLESPGREEFTGCLDTVLAAIYAAFGEGWTDATGLDGARRDLSEEAMFLARLVSQLLPQEPEPLGLLALMLHAEARRRARRSPTGEFVPFAEQDISLWDWQMILEAESLLRRASVAARVGRYQLEGALQSAHVFRAHTGKANWQDVVELYDSLFALTHSPVVAINRALAIAEIDGPNAALAAMPLDSCLNQYQSYWAARADLHARAGAIDEARKAYDIAIGLERDIAVRRFLLMRQGRLAQ